MENFLSLLILIIMGAIGGIPTIAITVSIPVIIIQKIIGKVKEGKSIYA